MPRKHEPLTCSPTLQGPYPYQQIKVLSQPQETWWYAASKAVVPTKPGHPESDRR